MDWRNVKDVSFNGKAAKRVLLNSRVIWEKGGPEPPEYAVLYSENPTVVNWLRTKYTFEDYTVGIKMSEAKAITELPAASSALKSGLITFDELVYFTGVTSLGKRDDSSQASTSPFTGCTKLTSITLPDSCIALGRSCFDGCTKLVSINNCKVKEIYRSCFANCNALDVSTVDLSNVELIMGGYIIGYNQLSNTNVIDLSNLKTYRNTHSTSSGVAVAICATSGVHVNVKLPDYNQVTYDTVAKFISITTAATGYKITLYIKTGQQSFWNAKVQSGTVTWVEYD